MEQTAAQHTGLDALIRQVEEHLPDAPPEAVRGLTGRFLNAYDRFVQPLREEEKARTSRRARRSRPSTA